VFVRDDHGRLRVWDEESGKLHRELDDFGGYMVTALASFLSADGQQPRLVAGLYRRDVRVYDPEAGSVLHHLEGHTSMITALACIASPSTAPHHPRLVSASEDGTAKVWDGETGEMLADLRGHGTFVRFVAVWKEHRGGHDRIATTSDDGRVKIWDEAFTLLHDLDCNAHHHMLAFKSAEGRTRLLLGPGGEEGLQVLDPEEVRQLHDGINRGCPLQGFHLFESAEGRYLLASLTRHYDDEDVTLDVWDLGEAPAATGHVRPANKQG
jgi:WD40 repeat protein